jgi:hypothetical protein
MTYEEARQTIRPGRYRHFKGREYEVLGIARHSEDESPLVVYRALDGDFGLWVRPADMWQETVVRDGKMYTRFVRVDQE